jgi:hypothetical protein
MGQGIRCAIRCHDYLRLTSVTGSVCYLHILGQGLVFLNTPDAVFDLMDKRGAIYSDKPQLVKFSYSYLLGAYFALIRLNPGDGG